MSENAAPEWDGHGLPRAGITREYQDGAGQWHRVTITGRGLVGLLARLPGGETEFYIRNDMPFRPLEQIATQEREEAVRAMECAIVSDAEKPHHRQSCAACTQQAAEALYDAGYRKLPSA